MCCVGVCVVCVVDGECVVLFGLWWLMLLCVWCGGVWLIVCLNEVVNDGVCLCLWRVCWCW